MARKRSPATALVRLLDSSDQPMYLVDSDYQLLFANAACATWLNVDVDQLTGIHCRYDAAAPVDDWAATLCPPPSTFAHPGMHSAVIHGRQAYLYRLEQDDSPAGVLVVVSSQDAAVDHSETIQADAQQLHRRIQAIVTTQQERLPDPLIGESALSERLRQQVSLVTQQYSHVVISGPNGSGRETLARRIHYGTAAHREEDRSLIPVAGALMDAELLQTTIRNYAQTSENDAARPPVLLILEVDMLSTAAQAELAGFMKLPTFDLPTIATSRTELRKLAETGAFLPELALRLATVSIEVPSLADRKEDIPIIAQYLLEQHQGSSDRQLEGFSNEAMDQLLLYDWPENLAELHEVVAASVEQASGPWIEVNDLPPLMHEVANAAKRTERPIEEIKLDDFMESIERELFRRVMREARGNKTRAAELLGISRARMHRRWEQLGFGQDNGRDEQASGDERRESETHLE